MDAIRLGLLLRALRLRLGWRQEDLSRRSGRSQSAISRVELGQLGGLTVETLDRLAGALGARLDIRSLWHGGDIDRLLDAEHARLVESVLRRLERRGWRAEPEVTFSVYGERGSIDVLARHPARPRPLVIEVKTTITDVQETISTHGRKTRLAPTIDPRAGRAAGRAEPADRLLVVAGTRLARRRVADHAATFDAAYPVRGPALRHWLTAPPMAGPPMSGLLFVTLTRRTGGMSRRRIRRHRTPQVPRTSGNTRGISEPATRT